MTVDIISRAVLARVVNADRLASVSSLPASSPELLPSGPGAPVVSHSPQSAGRGRLSP